MLNKILAASIPCNYNRQEVIESKSCVSLVLPVITDKDFDDDSILLGLYKVVKEFYLKRGGVLDEEIFSSILDSQKVEEDKKKQYLSRFYQLKSDAVDKAKCYHSLELFIESKKLQLIDNGISSMLLTLEGKEDLTGKPVVDVAQDKVQKLYNDLQTQYSMNEFPSGDVREDSEEMREEYLKAKSLDDGVFQGITMGISKVDNVTGGAKPGDLIVFAMASGEGKTMFLTNYAWFAAVMQGKNVCIVTIETIRTQYRRRLIARHSNHPKFGLIGQGLKTTEIERGTLNEKNEEIYGNVLRDWGSNTDYGTLDVIQMPEGSTVTSIRSELEERQSRFDVDLVIIDYLSLLSSDTRRTQRREELADIFRAAKSLAVTFNSGQGTVVCSAHQIPTASREKVRPTKEKFYTMRSVAETSEAYKSPDMLIAALRTPEMEEQHEVMGRVVKARNSENSALFMMYENYTSAYLGNLDDD